MPLDVLAQDVNVPLPNAPNEASIINFILAHPDVFAAIIVSILLVTLWRSKYKPILIILGTILATVVVLRMRGR